MRIIRVLTVTKTCSAALLWMAASIESRVLAAPADVDQSFGKKGFVTNQISGYEATGQGLVVTGDKIALAGYYTPGANTAIAMALYTPKGGLARTGVLPVGAVYARATSVAVDANGNFVLAGFAGGFYEQFVVARYDNNGILDNHFGQGGIVLTPVRGNAEATREWGGVAS
jgi:hypothetical protein